MLAGHIFVIRGDITNLACDAWLVPTDRSLVLEDPWKRAVPDTLAPPPGWDDERVRAFEVPGAPDRTPRPWLANVGSDEGTPTGWYLDGVRQFLRAVATRLAGTAPLFGRARPLVALPVVGTGAGGAARAKGELMAALLDALDEEARALGIDVVLVTRTAAAYAAAQAYRRQKSREDDGVHAWAALDAPLRREAKRLGDLAAGGQLVLFIGAGVSVGAGLPVWAEMLELLAEDAGLTNVERQALGSLDVRDRTRIIDARLALQQVRLGERVADLFSGARPSLAHALLASQPVQEAATTNYDTLYETARACGGRPVAVLPYESPRGSQGWLLKLHGCITRPDDIVLTRDDYLRYAERRAALAGIVQALLITRHMLFVGFSLSDDNFHRIVHDVRNAVRLNVTPQDGSRFGTALLPVREPFVEELWSRDIQVVSLGENGDIAEAARRMEIFLDLLALEAFRATPHLLDDTYDGILTHEERVMREAVRRLKASIPEDLRESPAWEPVRRFLTSLGDADS